MRPSALSSTVQFFPPQRLRDKLHRITLVLAFGATLWPAPPVAAGEPTFFLPYGVSVFEISTADLVTAVPGATGQVLSNTPPEHGPLFNLGTAYQYQPTEEFFEQGLDSFHYEVTVGTTNVWTTAYLVAGMHGDGFFSMSLDDPESEMDSVDIHNNDKLSINDTNPINGSHDLQFELDGPPVFVQPKGDDTVAGNGSLGSGLDDGGSGPDLIGAEMVIATAYDSGEEDVVRVLIVDGLNGPELAAEIRSDSSSVFTRTQGVAIESGDHWMFQWWTAAASGSRDGGALLWINGVVEDILSGLDNTNTTFAGWRFGAIDPANYSGVFRLDDLIAERGLTVPRPLPVFADNFEGVAPVWSDGSCGATPQPTASIGVLTVPINSTAVDCFRSRTFTEPQRHHRVRLTVDLEDAILAPLDSILLLVGRRTVAPPNQLQLVVRRTGGGILQMRAKALLDNLSFVQLPWVNLPDASEREVELHWWAAAPGSSDGGLRLTIDNVLVSEALGLANSTMTVEELRLGAMGVDTGSFGHVTFGGIEAWQ